jgi:hypothetical protein
MAAMYGALTHEESETLVRVIGKLVDRLVEIGG